METIEQALGEIAAGRPVVVVDGEDRENEGDLIVAADRITASMMAFVVRHTSGYVCVALPAEECDRLGLPPAHISNDDRFATAYRVAVDAAEGVTTGISARDRAHTARMLAASSTTPEELTRPGHVVPLAARPGGVLERGGHTEAAVDLTRMAGLRAAGVLCEVVSAREPGRMAERPELVDFASEHGLAMITIEDLVAYRRATGTAVERLADVDLPTDAGHGRLIGYRGDPDGAEHVAFVAGDVGRDGAPVPVHVHVECVLGDVFGSRACACARRLDDALRDVASSRHGVVIYLRGPGRSPVQDLAGHRGARDVITGDRPAPTWGDRAESVCGPVDAYAAVAILDDLGITSISHLHNPAAVAEPLQAVLPGSAAPSTGHAGRPDDAALRDEVA
jgi:3,4-dihydroxy 2-butanone 4-phosphate synthase/GTP cyclohydrolase II